MDKKKFIEIIDECSDWYYPKIPDNGSTQWTNNPRISSPAKVELGPQIIKYKQTNTMLCDWCNEYRPINRLHQKVWVRSQCQGWKHRCLTCNKSWDEKTKTLKHAYGRKVD